MLWEILLFVTVVWLLKRQWQLRRQIALAKQLKTYLRSYPIVGHSCMLLGSDEDRMRAFETIGKDAIKAGGISKIWQPTQLFVCVADPVVAEVLMKQCLEKHEVMNVTRFLIGNGSINAPVKIWRPRRKIVATAFSVKYLNQYAEIFTKQSILMADLMQKEAGQGAFSFWNYISKYAFDSICESTLGVKVRTQGSRSESDVTFLNALDKLMEMAELRMCQPWFRSNFIFRFMWCYDMALIHRNTIWEFLNKIIRNKWNIEKDTSQKAAEESKTRMPSFLDVQSSDINRRLNVRELLEESLILMIAGTDTSAVGTAFSILMLSRHPDVQEKVSRELHEVFEDSSRPVTANDLPQLKYLEAVIKETLRLFPPVPVTVRRVDHDVTLPSGLVIVQGCGLLINHWAIHRHPDYWGPDPDQFRPERFLDFTPKHPAAFIAFSYGSRNCPGSQYAMMSMKTVVATLLRRYRVLPAGPNPGPPLRTKFNLMLKDVHGYQIRLENRI